MLTKSNTATGFNKYMSRYQYDFPMTIKGLTQWHRFYRLFNLQMQDRYSWLSDRD